jgi:hypothetical protein
MSRFLRADTQKRAMLGDDRAGVKAALEGFALSLLRSYDVSPTQGNAVRQTSSAGYLVFFPCAPRHYIAAPHTMPIRASDWQNPPVTLKS